MNAESLALAAGKAALKAFREWAKKKVSPMGEWRGHLVCDEHGKYLWEVGQDDADPCRLYIPVIGFEYSWAGGEWFSDGPSIPWAACKILDCSREDFLRSGFLHDFSYRTGGVYVRQPGGKWSFIPLRKRESDVLLAVGISAEGATNAQETAIYAAVQTPIGKAAWRMWRKKREGKL